MTTLPLSSSPTSLPTAGLQSMSDPIPADLATALAMSRQLGPFSRLAYVVETGSTIAILDITGVPTVDTLVAQHLLKTVAAARLMGADCIISGIRPQIAQTIVHLGIDLATVVTKATLAEAFAMALDRQHLAVGRKTVVPASRSAQSEQ